MGRPSRTGRRQAADALLTGTDADGRGTASHRPWTGETGARGSDGGGTASPARTGDPQIHNLVL